MEAWREELYLQHGLFDNLRSKYKTVSSTVKTKASNATANAKKVVSNTKTAIKKTTSTGNREWKNHKYIRKEGNRYIYKEPQKTSNKKYIHIDKNTNDSFSSLKGRVSKNLKVGKNATYDFNGTKTVFRNSYGYAKGLKAAKSISDVKRTFSKAGANKNQNTKMSYFIDNVSDPTGWGWHGIAYDKENIISSVEYKNGKKWLDSIEMATYEDVDYGIKTTETIYTINYGYLHQAVNKTGSALNRVYNKGKSFIENRKSKKNKNNNETVKEKRISEQIIPEEVLTEQIIPETKLQEKKIKDKKT